MEIRQLEYFVAVVETGSFTRAAQACGVVQTTVSHALAMLEGELGARLVHRSGRRVELTAEGRAFLPDAQLIVEHVRRAEQAARRRGAARGGLLRLGYYGDGLGRDFPEAVRRFRAQTGAAVEMIPADPARFRGDMADDLRLGYVDAFLIAHAPLDDALPWARQRVVAYNGVYLAMAVDDELAAGAGPVSREELRAAAPSLCVYRAASSERYGSAMRGWLARDFGLDSTVVGWGDDLDDINLRTRCGQCRTLLFRNCEAHRVEEGDMVLRLVDQTGLLPITCLWRADAAAGLAGRFAGVAREVSCERGVDVGCAC